MNKIEKRITAEIVTQPKQDKRGRWFFSVRYGQDKWLMCYITALHGKLQQDEQYTVITDGAKEYEKLLDIVSDEVGIEYTHEDEPRKPYRENVKPKEAGLPNDQKEIHAKLDEVLRIVKAIHDNQNPLL